MEECGFVEDELTYLQAYSALLNRHSLEQMSHSDMQYFLFDIEAACQDNLNTSK